MPDNRTLNIQMNMPPQTQDGFMVIIQKADTIDSDHQITAIAEKLDGLAKNIEI